MQNVEAREGKAAGADFLHAALILAAPGIGEGEPFESEAARREDRLGLRRDAAAPVGQRAEHIEKESLYCRVERQFWPQEIAFQSLFIIEARAAVLREAGQILPMLLQKTQIQANWQKLLITPQFPLLTARAVAAIE